MIQIICGTCGTSQGYKTAASGELSLPAAEEQRLVARGVAEYVTRPVMGPAAVNVPYEETAAPNEDTAVLSEDEADTSDTLDIVDGHFTTESLMRMTRAEMEQLAADLTVDVSKCRNKGEIAALLTEVEVQAGDDDDIPPDLTGDAGDIVQ